MSAPRFGRFQKATTLLPLALLSTAVTAAFAGVGPQPADTALASEHSPANLPDGSSVPTEAIQAPASVTGSGVVAPGIRGGGSLDRAVSSASASGIPAAALAAYQRAETVINSADKSCHLPWQLVAAIGRVESDHGRVNGNTLSNKGVARPGIFGIALDGSNGTQKISDTDAGQYDADAKWDRAVGPMQFIPSTWSVVGVDGDNDGQRNPQDINDAALATAVYLCSGPDDLSTTAGQRAAVYRYNHSQDYVDLVLSFMNAYLSGNFTSVPNSLVTSSSSGSVGYFTPAPPPKQSPKGPKHGSQHQSGPAGGTGGSDGPGGSGGDSGDSTVDNPVTPPADDGDGGGGGVLPDLPLPSVKPPNTGGGGSGGGGGGGGGVGGTVKDTLTKADAKLQCLNKLGLQEPIPALQLPKLTACMLDLGF